MPEATPMGQPADTAHPAQATGQVTTLQEVKAHIDDAIVRYIMVVMSVAAIGGTLVFVGLSLMPEQSPGQRLTRLVSGGVVLVAWLISMVLYQRKSPRVAAAFFATAAFLVGIGSAWRIGSGVASTGAIVPVVWIVVLGLVIGPRAGNWASKIASAAVLMLWGAQYTGVIPGLSAANMQPSGSYAVVLVLIFLLIGATIKLYSKLFWNAMHGIDQARNELQAKVRQHEKTQDDLLESKRRLTALLDHAPMSVLIFDKEDGHLHYANRHALQAHGVSRTQDLAGLCLYSDAPYSRADLQALIQRMRLDGPQELTWRSQSCDGRVIWWAIRLDMLSLDDGQYAVSFGHDITARLQAEQTLIDHRAQLEEQVRARTEALLVQQHRLEALIDALPVGLSIKDTQGRYQLINRLFEEAAGMPKSAVLGSTAEEIFPPAQSEKIVAHDQDLLQGTQMVRYESSHMKRDGGRKDHLITKVPLLDAQGQPEAILSLTVDISDQKAMQRELAAAKNEAEHLASVKSAFLANMSHEIRTPLHGMLGMAQIGQRLTDQGPQGRLIFERISRSGRHLLGVINDILDFSKIDAGKLGIDDNPIDPKLVAQEALAMVEDRARDKGLALTLQCEPTPALVMGDPLRTRQILINLLSNAVKFTEQGEVRLHLSVREGQLQYAICDTGIGMHPEEQARVFSPFEQADGSTSRRYGGTGLGLSISQQLARLMGGDIRLHSALGEGSTFILTLPLRETTPPQLGPQALPLAGSLATSPHKPQLSGLHILAADDVDINRDILVGLLSQHDAQVHCCENGKEALALLREKGPGYFDIVLMDVQMPVMNGLQATQLLHMIEPGLPVVALTAHAMADECVRCKEAGMVGHLAKPFDTDDLLQVIVKHARRPARHDLPARHQPPEPLPEQGDPTIDLAAALRRCGGQDALLHQLITRFCDEQAGFAARCQHMLHSEPDLARQAAHRLKGTAANLGLPLLAQHASELENALQTHNVLLASRALITLDNVIGQHTALLRHWLREHQPA